MIKTVILDLDDTLYDEIDYCRSGLAAVAEYLAALHRSPAADTLFQALWRQFAAGNRTKTFNAALTELGVTHDDRLIGELILHYRNHIPKITLPPDSRHVLAQLAEKYTLALLSDGFLPAQRLKVRALGIEHYFKTIVFTEELGREFWKPSSAGFEKILQTLDTAPEAATYVADNEAKDFIAPNDLGMTTIQLIRPNRIHALPPEGPETSRQQSQRTKPDHRIHRITDLPGILDGL